MDEAQIASLQRALRLKPSKYWPTNPFPKQAGALLLLDTLEVLYGGAAGGGKSEYLLYEATRFVDDYPTKSLLIRRTYKDLAQPGGLMARSHEWFRQTDAHWDGQNATWRFPSGATLTFGYMEHEGDELRYQGGEYHMVGFDELTQIREHQYLYLFSRTRRLKEFAIPIRIRGATNPGGPGHEWVRKRFKLPKGPDWPQSDTRKYVRSLLNDNPHLDREEYWRSLQHLPEVTRLQLEKGDWKAMSTGGYFHPENFIVVTWDMVPEPWEFRSICRYWDFGATEKTELSPDPDWTAGVKGGIVPVGKQEGNPPDWYIMDVERFREGPGNTKQKIKATARRDGPGVTQWFEQERGAAALHFIHHYKELLYPTPVKPLYATGTKEARAKLAATRVDDKQVYLVDGPWIEDFVAEHGAFPEGDHDDQVDGFSNLLRVLEKEKVMAHGGKATRVGAQGRVRQRGRPRRTRTRNTEGRHVGY